MQDPPIWCDNYRCPERGDFPRCYLDIFKLCRRYDGERTSKEDGRGQGDRRGQGYQAPAP